MKNSDDSVSRDIEALKQQLELRELRRKVAEEQARPGTLSRSDMPITESPLKYGVFEDVKDEDRGEIEGIFGIVDRSELLLCESPTSHKATGETQGIPPTVGASLGEAPQVKPLSKPVREGETVDILRAQLRRVRTLYRDNGWTASQIRRNTESELSILWEWVDRIPISDRGVFLEVHNWDYGDDFIYRQIRTLYTHSPHHRKRPPSPATVRDWRKQFRRDQKDAQG
jgi:hypothetical protein